MKIKFLFIIFLSSKTLLSNNDNSITKQEPKKFSNWSINLNYGIINNNLKNINNSFSNSSNKLKSINHALVFGIFYSNQNFSFATEYQFPKKQRIFISNYEQISFYSDCIIGLIGKTYIIKEKKVFIYPQIGISFGEQLLFYNSDSISKPTSVNWLNVNTNPESEIYFSNPNFSLIGKIRILKMLNRHIGTSVYLSYQRDLSRGEWRFQDNFVIRNSPKTYFSGFSTGISLFWTLFPE